MSEPRLDLKIADAIDDWRKNGHPDLTILETLGALETVRHLLTEKWLQYLGLHDEGSPF